MENLKQHFDLGTRMITLMVNCTKIELQVDHEHPKDF